MKRRVAVLACGALAREVREVIERRRWDVDLHTAPALNHLSPKRLAVEVDQKLEGLAGRYERVVVVYGDCGTAGALDAALARHGAVRTGGPHCYEMLGGASATDAESGTFFLTDWLVRNWSRATEEGLGLDRFPWMKHVYFGRCTRMRYLRQRDEPELEERARAIADDLGLPLEIHDVGLGELERRLVDLVER